MKGWENAWEEQESLCQRFARWLFERRRFSYHKADDFRFKAHCLADYLMRYRGLTLQDITPGSLQRFLYDHGLREFSGWEDVESALPRAIGMLYGYLHVQGHIADIGWIQDMCKDETRYQARRQGYVDLFARENNSVQDAYIEWTNALSEEICSTHLADGRVEGLAICRDMRTLLGYIRDNKVVATQARLNLPLKVVRAINEQFVNPGVLDHKLGNGTVFKLRSEDEARRVAWLDIIARAGEILEVGRGRRLVLTPDGAALLAARPCAQAWTLFDIWWYRVNWLVNCPLGALPDQMPFRSERTTLERLLPLPVGVAIPFEAFADELVAAIGLPWQAEHDDWAVQGLRHAIESMVIKVLEEFEAAALHYTTVIRWNRPWQELEAFEVTPFGHQLLQSVR